jgi:predicted Zn-dependent protease
MLTLALLGSPENPQKKNSDIDNIGNRNINKGSINFTSIEKEITLGRQLAAEVESQSRLLTDREINEYVNRVGQRIVRNSDSKVPFTIKIIDSEEVNAFALPGGFFYVNTSLILAADDEAELAGVMAHEIAHVAARHGTEQQSKAQLVNLASIPLIFLGGAAGYGIRQAAGFLVPMGFLKFSRKAEEEADFLGVQYLYKTGYDPSAMIRFFEKLQAREKARPDTMSDLFLTHPPTAKRIRLLKESIDVVLKPREEYVETTSNFERIKAKLAKLDNSKRIEEDRPTLRRRTRSPADVDEGRTQQHETTSGQH